MCSGTGSRSRPLVLHCWYFCYRCNVTHRHGFYCVFPSPWTSHANLLLLEIRLPGFSGDLPLKCTFLDFIPVSGSRLSFLTLYSDTRGRQHLGFLINKTVGPQYSLWCLPPGISVSQPRWRADIWILMGIYFFRSLVVRLPCHCFCFSGSWRNILFHLAGSCQTQQSKGLIPARPSWQTHIIMSLRRQNEGKQLFTTFSQSSGDFPLML